MDEDKVVQHRKRFSDLHQNIISRMNNFSSKILQPKLRELEEKRKFENYSIDSYNAKQDLLKEKQDHDRSLRLAKSNIELKRQIAENK